MYLQKWFVQACAVNGACLLIGDAMAVVAWIHVGTKVKQSGSVSVCVGKPSIADLRREYIPNLHYC